MRISACRSLNRVVPGRLANEPLTSPCDALASPGGCGRVTGPTTGDAAGQRPSDDLWDGEDEFLNIKAKLLRSNDLWGTRGAKGGEPKKSVVSKKPKQLEGHNADDNQRSHGDDFQDNPKEDAEDNFCSNSGDDSEEEAQENQYIGSTDGLRPGLRGLTRVGFLDGIRSSATKDDNEAGARGDAAEKPEQDFDDNNNDGNHTADQVDVYTDKVSEHSFESDSSEDLIDAIDDEVHDDPDFKVLLEIEELYYSQLRSRFWQHLKQALKFIYRAYLTISLDDFFGKGGYREKLQRLRKEVNLSLLLFPPRIRTPLARLALRYIDTLANTFEEILIISAAELLNPPPPPPPPPPPAPQTIRYIEADEDEEEDYTSVHDAQQNRVWERIWNHFTISRDQTASSNFAKELLLILSEKGSHNRTDSEEEPGIAITFRRSQSFPVPPPPAAPNLSHSTPPALARLHANSPRIGAPSSAMVPNRRIKDEPRSKDGVSPMLTSGVATTTGNDALDELLGRISVLEMENSKLKGSQEVGIRFETIYFIWDENQHDSIAYSDEPGWSIGPKGEIILKAHFPIPDVEGYIQQNQGVDFIIGKFYSARDQRQEIQKASRDKKQLPSPKPKNETIRLETEEMREALEAYIEENPKLKEEFFPSFDPRHPLEAPYIFWYHHRCSEAFEGLTDVHRKYMVAITDWINANYGEMYFRVDKQLERKRISYESMIFLVKPGDAMIVNKKLGQTQGKFLNGRISKSYPNSLTPQKLSTDEDSRWKTKSKGDKKKYTWKWELQAWSYKYDGSFVKDTSTTEIIMTANELDEEIEIQKLNAYPLKYASEETIAFLENRGKSFWSCRERRLVSYEDEEGLYGSAERLMVDFSTYKQLHSDTYTFKRAYNTIDNPEVARMDASVMENDDPPPAPELYVFPDTIPAYNLRNKKWVDLHVDRIRDVKWHKASFAHLVIDSETKELVQALITNQIAREQGTDIIESKGNGLIILLHGGPGTGKTFTAESVAEMAEKPLFRVTCGDIGTKPEEVEQYLESVLHLSKIWGCVVLLDEADVFLEQRELTDLERNALVSVFLRVLEYYEGILILTSNRVGTFDEAFKSRIQLSLHYENLTKGQRYKIWKNFLNRLKQMEKDAPPNTVADRKNKDIKPINIDFDDVECYLNELAEVELNGRQIRNAITTARQLAMFKEELMNYSHLKHVIKVSSKFDTYLTKLREGLTDDEIAREQNVR